MSEGFKHPCFENIQCGYRFHIPVAPKCDTKCNFCRRAISDKDIRPGVTDKVISTKEVRDFINEKLELYPECKVMGIAGPGDPFANADEIFETFRIIKENYPDKVCCTCTNGFYVPLYENELKNSCIDYMTVTVNSIYPETLSRIYDFLIYDGRKITGLEMGILIQQLQKKSLEIISDCSGITLKINIVIIPGVNDTEVIDIIRETIKYNVHIYNFIPVIPTNGTKFEGVEAWGEKQINELKNKVRVQFPNILLKDKCHRCRADACGVV